MILRTDRLSDLLAQGNEPESSDPLCIVPMPNLDELRANAAASIDLRLGTWFAHPKQAKTPYLPLDANEFPDITSTTYVPFGGSYFLHPQSFVLAVTMEWLSIPSNFAAYVVGKSSWGRCGLIIATAVGVHPGYKGCLTLELTNVGEIPIEIQPGVRICQLFIHAVEASSEAHGPSVSSFGGFRRPILKPIQLDPYAQRLHAANAARLHMRQ